MIFELPLPRFAKSEAVTQESLGRSPGTIMTEVRQTPDRTRRATKSQPSIRRGRLGYLHPIPSESAELMRLICSLILLFSSLQLALADGGAVQLQAAAPPFVVTVFTDPPQCRAGQVDLSVLVQEEKGPVLDAEVVASLSALEPAKTNPIAAWLPPACASTAAPNLQNVPLQIAQGTNRLFYSTLIQIPFEERWQLQVSVRRGTDHATIQGILNVDAPLPPMTAYWQWFLVPFLAIGGFALNQHIRTQRRQKIAKADF
jgi:hypothetical protein